MSHLVPLPASVLAGDDAFPGWSPVALHDAVSPARRRHRQLIAAAGRWALARGVSLPPDHVALWAATVEELGATVVPGDTTGPWRASHIARLSDAIAAWCSLAGCFPPVDLVQSLWHLYGFLAETGRLHPNSDALDELRAAVVVFAGFTRFGRERLTPPAPTAA